MGRPAGTWEVLAGQSHLAGVRNSACAVAGADFSRAPIGAYCTLLPRRLNPRSRLNWDNGYKWMTAVIGKAERHLVETKKKVRQPVFDRARSFIYSMVGKAFRMKK